MGRKHGRKAHAGDLSHKGDDGTLRAGEMGLHLGPQGKPALRAGRGAGREQRDGRAPGSRRTLGPAPGPGWPPTPMGAQGTARRARRLQRRGRRRLWPFWGHSQLWKFLLFDGRGSSTGPGNRASVPRCSGPWAGRGTTRRGGKAAQLPAGPLQAWGLCRPRGPARGGARLGARGSRALAMPDHEPAAQPLTCRGPTCWSLEPPFRRECSEIRARTENKNSIYTQGIIIFLGEDVTALKYSPIVMT